MKIGFFTLLTIALIVLKILGLLHWSWFAIFLPAIIYAFVILILSFVTVWIGNKKQKL